MGRPAPRFHGFIGHHELIDPLRRELAGAVARNEPFTHTLLTGPSGVGKTQLARALAAERGTRLVLCLGYTKPEQLVRKLAKLQDGDFFFIDEGHRMKPLTQELLFEAIERRRVLRVSE
jgi:Holliday junction DNA helicase RuvB